MKTSAGRLSKLEARKSLRDAFLFSVAFALPDILNSLQVLEFGEYTDVVRLACAIALPLINRWLNLLRVHE